MHNKKLPVEEDSSVNPNERKPIDELVMRSGSDVFKFAGYLMNLLNERELGLEVYGQILDYLIHFLGIGAAAIRLKLGEDFPFFVTRGFSDRFLEEDNFICLRDQSGNVTLTETGCPNLICFCGAVLSQDVHASDVKLTGHGIFCANGADELNPAGRGIHVKSAAIRCFMDGYTALCLTPVRSSSGISGLLILADTKPLRLTHELNTLLQILSFGMGAAFDRLLPSTSRQNETSSVNERLFQNIFSQGPVGIAVADTIDYRFIKVNERLCEIVGYSAQELAELTILDLIHPEDEANELKIFEDLLNGRMTSLSYERRLVRKDKKPVWTRVTVFVLFNGPDQPPMAVGMVEDIDQLKIFQDRFESLKKTGESRLLESKSQLTSLKKELESGSSQRKALEAALKDLNTRFEAMSEAAGDIVFFKNKKLNYTYVNSTMAKTFGRSQREIIGKTAYDLFSVQSAEQIKHIDMRVIAGETVEMESVHWIDGAQTYFQELKTPVKDSAGKIVGIMGLVKNITERKKAQNISGASSLDYPSPAMRTTMEKAAFAADTDSIVLFQGESGSGKDHVARWIHEHSKRSSGPFLGINCAALPHELAESELFGHEQGAFTGAKGRKRGLLELAESGTLLLNEIGELSLTLQAKLLTFLDTRSFMRVGGEKSIKVNARIMAATHRDLKEEVAEGRFERALFYRLNVFSIAIPPLRERLDDLPMLTQEMITKLAQEIQLQDIPEITAETVFKLAQYDWPGNVRELRNVLERGLMLSRGPQFVLPAPLVDGVESWSHRITFPEQKDLSHLMREIRINLCNEALRRSSGNRSKAASLLGISRDAFYRYLKERPSMSENKTEFSN